MSNKIKKVGDSIIITIKPKQRGTAIVSSYEDNLIGLAVGKRVKREYRIVEDNLFYSDWKMREIYISPNDSDYEKVCKKIDAYCCQRWIW